MSYKNQVRAWRIEARRRSAHRKFWDMYALFWDRLKTPLPMYKCRGPLRGIFANSRDGYTRGSHMCTERRADILARRARGACQRNHNARAEA